MTLWERVAGAGIIVALVALLGAGTIARYSGSVPTLEQRIERLPERIRLELWREALAQQSEEPNAKCKLSRDLFPSAPWQFLAICEKYGTRLYWAAMDYPEYVDIYMTYFNEEKFWSSMRLSSDTVWVVDNFMREGSKVFRMNSRIAELIAHARGEKTEQTGLTPVQFGLMAIYDLDERKHQMLAEVTRDVDGTTRRLRLTRAINYLTNFFAGSSMRLERVVVEAARSPTWGEIGGAALEVAVLGAGVAAKVLGPARNAVRTAQVLRKTRLTWNYTKTASAMVKSLHFGTVAKVGIVATVVATVLYPQYMLSTLRSVAEYFGMDWYRLVFAIAFVVLVVFVPGAPLLLYALYRIARRLLISSARTCVKALCGTKDIALPYWRRRILPLLRELRERLRDRR